MLNLRACYLHVEGEELIVKGESEWNPVEDWVNLMDDDGLRNHLNRLSVNSL